MYKKTLKYEDYDGNEVVEDFYFNLNKAELVELQLSKEGGLEDHLRRIVAEDDKSKLVDMFKKIILLSYGIRTPDGKRFVKNEQVRDDFVHTPAYAELFVELASDADAAAAFIQGILPKNMAAVEAPSPEAPSPTAPQTFDELVKLSDEEFERIAGNDPQLMSKIQLQAAMARKIQK